VGPAIRALLDGSSLGEILLDKDLVGRDESISSNTSVPSFGIPEPGLPSFSK
jgi:hypothetical protein